MSAADKLPENPYGMKTDVFRRIYHLQNGMQLSISFWHGRNPHTTAFEGPVAFAYYLDKHVRLKPGYNSNVMGSGANVTWSVKELSMDSFDVESEGEILLGYGADSQAIRNIKLPLNGIEGFSLPGVGSKEEKLYSLVFIVVLVFLILFLYSKS